MDPATATIIASALGFTGGLLDDEPDGTQRRRSFTESPVTDPRTLLAESVLNTRAMNNAFRERANKPVQLRSRAVSSVGRQSSPDPAEFASPGFDIGAFFGMPGAGKGNTQPNQPLPREEDTDGLPVRRRTPRREML